MQQLGPGYENLMVQLFPSSFLSLIKLHSHFESLIKERKAEKSYLIDKIGDILINMVINIDISQLKIILY